MSRNLKQKSPKGAEAATMPSKIITDPRFKNIQTDPRFRLPNRKQTHVTLDKRFAHMLHDDDFSKKAQVDKYGRRLPKQSGRKELERFYRLDEDEKLDGEEVEQDENVEIEPAQAGRKYDPARDGGFSDSSSSEDESEESDLDGSEHGLDEAAYETGLADGMQSGAHGDVPMGEVSSRIAVVNLDWDNIRAVDLMAVASSFVPTGGRISRVSVYTSEFGRERMEREELEGPPPELFTSKSSRTKHQDEVADIESSLVSDEEEDTAVDDRIKSKLLAQSTDSNVEVDSHALRSYQISRLRYYYAVISCDNDNTALALYNEMDGREYLSTANFFDLRFVPDSVTFDDPITDKPRDECTTVPDDYRPADFVTDALTHSNVKLTWDEEDQSRKDVQKRAFSRAEVDENDLKAYIGSDSDNSSDAEQGTSTAAIAKTAKAVKAEAARQKMRAALGLPMETEVTTKSAKSKSNGEKTQPVGDMQITFTAGLSSTQPDKDLSVFTNRPEDVIQETTREAYIRKERERKARRKAKSQAARSGVEVADNGIEVDSQVEAVEEAGKETEEDPFKDPFFEDPAAANAVAKKEARREKRRRADAQAAADAEKKQREREELQALINDGGNGTTAASHFDMNEIRRREKQEAKKSKKGKKSRTGDALAKAEDDFNLDVADPRFSRLFDSHEFAIDPSHPRFSGTKGMKSLLEEGRRKRKGEELVTEAGDGQSAAQPRPEGISDGTELDELVEKVKRRKV